MQGHCGGKPWAVPSKDSSRCGQDVGSPLPPGHGPSQAALVPLPPACRKMWEPKAAASSLPQLLIKPLSICRRLHGSGRAHRSALGSTGLINPCSAGAATPAAGDGSCGRRCRHPVGPQHSHSTSRACLFPPRAQPQRHKPRLKLQEDSLRWLSPSMLEKGPHGGAEGSQGVPAPSPAHPKLPPLPSSSQGHLPRSITVCVASGAGWIHCPLNAMQHIPHRSTYMAHCSFSFLMEPYSACREKSGGQQESGARLGSAPWNRGGTPDWLRDTGG